MENKQTLLIVEDEIINRKILVKILAPEFNIVEVSNGAEAWSILTKKDNNIDAVLTDIVMPVMDGYTLLDKIRQASLTELPVIVMTGDSDVESEKKALSAGAWDFVTKPFEPQIMLVRIHNAMARRQVSVYKRMRKMAAHDPLTGMHNRNRMFEKTRQIINANPDVKFAFYRADINHFALYNTAFGEDEGDKLLCYLADQFKSISKEYPLYSSGRITADVFCACIPYSGGNEKLISFIDTVQKKLKEYRKNYRLELAVGVYIVDDPTISIEEMYFRASMAAEKCKSQYGNHIGYYDKESGKQAAAEMEIVNDMEEALQENQFVVYFQPKVNVATNAPAGAEALIRWIHPKKGIVSPNDFIPVFEGNGFIAKLDYYVWESTCRMLRSWLDAGYTPNPISVNVSRISMYNPQIVDDLVGLVNKYDLSFNLLQLEITESAYMTSPELMQEIIHNLRIAGFTILMDDFGSGYSSLNTLKDIEVDILKIDMKFLPVEQDKEKGEIILASMIKMASWIGMEVVVEGVESEAQRDFLEGAGCNYIQGYYYAKPMPQSDYENNYVFCDKIVEQTATTSSQKNGSKILIIDDNEIDRNILTLFLQEQFAVAACSSAEEALLYLKRHQGRVRLIVVDNMMPGMSGIDFLTYCQDVPLLRTIPQIMVTAGESVETQTLAFARGAYDFITKPLCKEVIIARVKHIMEISKLYRSFETMEYNYRNRAHRDSFTGLLNENAFNEIANQYVDNYPTDICALMVFDIDDFKSIIDKYGNQTGDEVIKCVTSVLSKKFRKSDLIGKFDGSKFTVMMANLPNHKIARQKATEIIKAVSVECTLKLHIDVAMSIGVAFRECTDTVNSIFDKADKALNDSKSIGKAKVVIYGENVPPVKNDEKPIVLVCSDDSQLYPSIALSYGDDAAFIQINNLDELHNAFNKYSNRIKVICLNMQKRTDDSNNDFYQYILSQGGGTTIPIIAACKEGDMEQLRDALKLKLQDVLFLPPQIDVIQRKLSTMIISGCNE